VKISKRRILGTATIGLMLAPIFASSIASADTASTTISSAVTAAITAFTTSGTVNVNVASASGVKQTVNTDTVTISTNDSAGYTLTLQDGNGSTALCITPGGSCTGIPATSGTTTTPALMSGANQWGFHIDNDGTKWCNSGTTCGATFGTSLSTNQASSATLKFASVPANASPYTIKTTSSTASSDVTNVWYGVNVDETQATGTYTDSVTYTATAN
jgi:hypothetical protein